MTLIDTGGTCPLRALKWVPKTVPTYAATHTNINYLKSRGISQIDDLYLSHHDADHIGDLPAILQAFRVERILVPAGMETEAGWQHLLRGVRQSPPVVPVTVGSQPRLQVRHPFTAAPQKTGNQQSFRAPLVA
ncbi:MBL fold metallo-hydrolase [Levilactobacillus brevis]|nr:MBL fold metallo-hydrolase [Levilactobacillus brevis]